MTNLNTLPEDVLLDVILLAIALADYRPSLREAPLNLSHTCSALRRVVLDQGRFWSRLNASANSENVVEVRAPLVELWLSRSADTLLDVSLGNVSMKSVDEMRTMLDRLVAAQGRWRTLRMNIDSSPVYRPSESSPVHRPSDSHILTHLPNLRELSITGEQPFLANTVDEEIITVQCIFISNLRWQMSPVAPHLTRLQVREFRAGRKHQIGLLAMLRHCPVIEDLDISFSNDPQCSLPEVFLDDNCGPGTCTLSRLTRIRITGKFAGLPFLNAIQTSSLQMLDMCPKNTYALFSILDFLEFPQFGPCVRRASLHYNSAKVEGILSSGYANAFCYELPNITHLHLHLGVLDIDSFLIEMADEEEQLLPLLEFLGLDILNGWCISAADSLITILMSRMAHNERFRVQVDTQSWSQERREEFRAFDGLGEWIASGHLTLVD